MRVMVNEKQVNMISKKVPGLEIFFPTEKIDAKQGANKKFKVAIFANGWNNVNLYRFLDGLYSNTPEQTIDYYLFVTYAIYSDNEVFRKSKSVIFDLPDLKDFDFAILYTPGLNFQDTIEKLVNRLKNSGLPIISIGLQYPTFYSVRVDNYTGMQSLCEHLINVHHIKNACYIAGSAENEDSNIRLKAVLDTMNKYGLEFNPTRDVFYSNWEVLKTYDYLSKFLENGEDIPEAIICANDQLAQGASYFLEDNGLQYIGKYIITGFDHLDEAQNFYPSIASVDQQYGDMGKEAVKLIQKIVKKEKCEKDVLIKCEFIPGESCGCNGVRDDEEMRHAYYRGSPRRLIGFDFREGRLNMLEQSMILATGFNDLRDRFMKEFGEREGQEGGTMAILFDPRIKDFSTVDIAFLEKYSFNNKMNIMFAKFNNKIVTEEYMDIRQLIPWSDDYGDNHMYVFSPIYYESFVCGYSVIADRIDWIKDISYNTVETRFRRGLISYRRNMQLADLNAKLSEIMEKDPLTAVKNRIAYERYISKLEEDFNSGNIEPFAVVYFDINNLKNVNDELGHEQGDIYIKNCCRFICDNYKHSPVFRIGGDEFVAILTGIDFDNRKEYLSSMRSKMQEIIKNKDSFIPSECISIASGMAEYNENQEEDFKAIFKHADEMMYQNKFIMKNGVVR